MTLATITSNGGLSTYIEHEDLEALMALALGAIDNRLDAGVPDTENYHRWRKLALRIADMVE
jgi:hypothetical protein